MQTTGKRRTGEALRGHILPQVLGSARPRREPGALRSPGPRAAILAITLWCSASCGGGRGASVGPGIEPGVEPGVEPGSARTGGQGPEEHDAIDPTDAALVASGIENAADLRAARARFESLAAPLLESLAELSDPRERGRQLLALLHQKGGLLGEYDARATTLAEILERRRYNCVSASVLYNLLAERVHLSTSAQLLPTHARTLLQLPDAPRPIVVETTSPLGFDPDVRMEASILAQVGGVVGGGARQLVPDRGSIVPTRVLIGTIYVNRASILQEAGQLGAAERLFARGEALADGAQMRRLLRDQRAALLSQLGADDVLSEDPARLQRAYRTLEAAIALEPDQAQIRAAVLQNLRAAVERLIHHISSKGREAELIALAEQAAALGMQPLERAGLRAFALSEVARLQIESGQLDAAVESIERALAQELGPGDAKLQATLAHNRISTLRLAAFAAAKEGDHARSRRHLARRASLPGQTREQLEEARADELRVLHLVGSKRIDDNQLESAAELYRDAVRRFPEDETSRHNLVAVLERLALPLIGRAECDRAAVFLEELGRLDPKSRFPVNARVRCLTKSAEERLGARDYAAAVALMRAARDTNPGEPSVRDNLAIALLGWLRSLAKEGRCAEVSRLARELRGLGAATVTPAELETSLGACR